MSRLQPRWDESDKVNKNPKKESYYKKEYSKHNKRKTKKGK